MKIVENILKLSQTGNMSDFLHVTIATRPKAGVMDA